jgi:hypothetical protein
MKYLMLIKHAESYRSQPMPQELLDAMGEFVAEGFKSGILKDTAGLKETAEGLRVRSSGGTLRVTDGPFTEAKEIIGGYAIVNAKSKAHAIELAKRFLEVVGEGESEVRLMHDEAAFDAKAS